MSEEDASVGIEVSATDFADGQALALRTFEMFANNRGFYNNTQNSHLRGKIGEIAAQRWLEAARLEVEALFRDDSKARDCDLVARKSVTIRLDVKTWDMRYWHDKSRFIA